jgi:hypothetical protein
MAAAANGPNMKSKGPAMEKEAQAMQTVQAGASSKAIHPGSGAGLRAGRGTPVEFNGQGYGSHVRVPSRPQVSSIIQGHKFSGRKGLLTDARTFKREAFEVDKKLAKLL